MEEVLTQHPAVMHAAVVARPDPTWGETPCAFLELKPGAAQPDDKEVIAFCRARLARFKVPKSFVYGLSCCPRHRREDPEVHASRTGRRTMKERHKADSAEKLQVKIVHGLVDDDDALRRG